ncbi:ATP12 family chaperone protein [Parvularcula marina]|uniref:ATP12 family chaperone protein n=1 Tax=Parvularcula marina TaxID=2292771 RepID=UPI003518F49A
MSESKPKRFYTDVTLSEGEGGYLIALDGRIAKTAGRAPLGAPQKPLADAIAAEWTAQDEVIDLATMPLTRLQGFALDGGEAGRTQWTDTVLSYLGSDLLCYRAPDTELAKRQADLWQPVLDRLGARWGERFTVTEGIMAVEQPDGLKDCAGERLSALAAGELYAVKLLTEITGSAALAFALEGGEADADEVFAAARLDETYQEEKWGVDEEAAARAANIRRDFDDVVRFLELSRA